MSFLNQICVDRECLSRRSCCHLGPRGEHCYFVPEQKLCSLLGLEWAPWITLDELLAKVRDRLNQQQETSDEYSNAIRKAQSAVTVPSDKS
jgi:hypothetical protein